jgi:hypothetical protein
LELMESPALRVLSRAAHLALVRLEIELRHHGGHDNGKLPVTKQNFVDFGIHQDAVAPALRELEALGIIRITQRGRGGTAEFRQPHLIERRHSRIDKALWLYPLLIKTRSDKLLVRNQVGCSDRFADFCEELAGSARVQLYVFVEIKLPVGRD